MKPALRAGFRQSEIDCRGDVVGRLRQAYRVKTTANLGDYAKRLCEDYGQRGLLYSRYDSLALFPVNIRIFIGRKDGLHDDHACIFFDRVMYGVRKTVCKGKSYI